MKPFEAYKIGVDVLDGCAKEAGLDIAPGDILVLHTGFLDAYLALSTLEQKALAEREQRAWCGVEASEEVLKWHWDHGISAVATDT